MRLAVKLFCALLFSAVISFAGNAEDYRKHMLETVQSIDRAHLALSGWVSVRNTVLFSDQRFELPNAMAGTDSLPMEQFNAASANFQRLKPLVKEDIKGLFPDDSLTKIIEVFQEADRLFSAYQDLIFSYRATQDQAFLEGALQNQISLSQGPLFETEQKIVDDMLRLARMKTSEAFEQKEEGSSKITYILWGLSLLVIFGVAFYAGRRR